MRLILSISAALLVLVPGPSAFALDKKDILKIAKKPHSRANLRPELKIFADGREYKIDYEVTPPGAEPVKLTFTARDKVVDGRYLVSIFRPPGAPNNIYTVLEFDRKESVYRKWVFVPDGKAGTIAQIVGTPRKGSREISWVNRTGPDGEVRTLEKHSDTGATWSEVHYKAGKVVLRTTGVAEKTR